jgi:hypothetical protein
MKYLALLIVFLAGCALAAYATAPVKQAKAPFKTKHPDIHRAIDPAEWFKKQPPKAPKSAPVKS